VTYLNEYFGIKYPLPKLDQLALPSTGAGGMENWGMIIYNDNALLYDPSVARRARSSTSSPWSRTKSRTSGLATSSPWRGGTPLAQ